MASHQTPAATWLAQGAGTASTVFLRRLQAMWQAHLTRRELSRLDARLLRDVGVTELQAARESSRAPWDLR